MTKSNIIDIGTHFANNWVIVKQFSCSEYRDLLQQATGESKQIKNTHYLCKNEKCGVETYLERTQIKRALDRNIDTLNKCKNCNLDNCYYKNFFRTYNASENIDRSVKVRVGDTNGFFTVTKIISAATSGLPQITLECKCNFCGNPKTLFMHHYKHINHTCDCMREGSMGESFITMYLRNHNINFLREYTYEGLVGEGKGRLRYDFALLNDENEVIGLIEFDGQQHYQPDNLFSQEGRLQIHDTYKNVYALEHNIPLLRVPYNQINKFEEIFQKFYDNLTK